MKAVMHAAAGRRHAGTFSHAATPKPLKSAWRENLKKFGKKINFVPMYHCSVPSVP